jgi:hypothetical protein
MAKDAFYKGVGGTRVHSDDKQSPRVALRKCVGVTTLKRCASSNHAIFDMWLRRLPTTHLATSGNISKNEV